MSEQQQAAKVFNFKFQLRKPKPGLEDEFYRVSMEDTTARDFAKMNEKIQAVIPATQKRIYTLTWTDSDGDEIIVGSSEALEIALNEMTGPVYKLTISLKKAVGAGAAGPREIGEPHVGVTCNSCDKDIHGFRYKCITCPEYDLCGKCEAKGLHVEHNMIRMASPDVAWPKHFFRRVGKLQEKMAANVASREKAAHQETHEKAHQKAVEAAGSNQGVDQRVVVTKCFPHICSVPAPAATAAAATATGAAAAATPAAAGTKKEDEMNKSTSEEEEPSIEDTIAQLSTHGTEYLRNLGSMISTTLDNLMVEEGEEEGDKSTSTKTTKSESKDASSKTTTSSTTTTTATSNASDQPSADAALADTVVVSLKDLK